jgi:crotonobetainyl-CoA:carnitine CoA-transferase CaiB-like acyl-CoA transferase
MPRGIYPTKDGYVYINSRPAWWPRLCRALDRPDLIDDPWWQANIMDMAHQPEMDAILYPWLLSHTKLEVMTKAQAQGIPAGALNTMEDVFEDPHFRERGFFDPIEHPLAGRFEHPPLPFKMLGTPGEQRHAPLLGQHTSQILRERLGYTPEEVVILRQRNVI